MQQGYYLRDIVTEEALALIKQADFFCGEIGITESLLRQKVLDGKKIYPMVSAHLGAKTRHLKDEELSYISGSLGLERILYFFDASRVRNGDFAAFADEIGNARARHSFKETAFFVPYFDLGPDERSQILSHLGKQDCSVMIPMYCGEGDSAPESLRDMVREASKHLDPSRLIVAFADDSCRETCMKTGKDSGVERAAVLL